MKKLLVILLALVLCLGIFVACDKDKTEEPEAPVVYNVNAAATYVHNMYKNKTTMTGDLEVTSKVVIEDVAYTVEWAATEGATITKKNDNTYIVDVNETTETEYTFTLTATVKAADGTTAVKSFTLTVPAYKVISFEEYMAAKKDDVVTIQGIVVAITSESKNNKYNHLFLADLEGKGGYYCYDLEKDPVKDLGIEVGMTVAVTATVSPYSGMQETKGGTAKIVNATKQNVEPKDITSIFAAGGDLKNYVGLPVTIKGVEIRGQDLVKDTDQYLNFILNGKTSYIRTNVTYFPLTLPLTKDGDKVVSADKATIDAAHAAKFGWTANATGILVLYNSAPYLIPMTTDCFTYIEYVEKTPAEKIGLEFAELSLADKIAADTEITVPTAGKYYSNVTLTWSSDNAAIAVAGGKLTVTMPTSKTTVTITVTAVCDGTTLTKTFTVELIPNTVSFFENTPYNFGFTDKNSVVKYLDGTNSLYQGNAVNYRWNLTDKAASAMVYFVEKTEGGYYIYYYNGEAKTYLNIVKSGTHINLLADAEPKSVWTYDAALEAMVVTVEGTVYMPKSYNNYNNVEAKVSTYEQGDTYVLSLMAVPFNFGFDKNGTMQYLDGTTAEGKAFRWNLTADAAAAALFYVEGNADGTYYIYFFKDNAKTYVNIVEVVSGTSTFYNLLADVEAKSKWTVDATTGAFVVVIGDVTYMVKSYNNFDTVEAKKSDYTYNETFVLTLLAIGTQPANPPAGGEGGDDVNPPVGENPPAGGGTEGGTTGETTTVTLSIQAYAAANNWSNSVRYDTITADANITITAIGSGYNNTGKYYTNGQNWRIYQSESPTLTITAAAGKTIKTVKITYDTANTGTLVQGSTKIASGTLVTVNANSVVFSVGNTGTATNGQAKITAIEIVYQ